MPKGGARSPTGVHVRKHSPDLRKPKPRPPHESLDSVGPSRHGAEAIREVGWWGWARAVNIKIFSRLKIHTKDERERSTAPELH